jgi:ABC-type amino acid transport substrate-binding protein
LTIKLVFILIAFSSLVEASVLTVNAEYNCPYFCDEKVTKKKGYLFEILTLFFESTGNKLNVNYIPFPRIFSKLKTDNHQLGVLPLIDINNNSLIRSFTSSVGINFSAIALRTKNDFDYIGINDLKGKKISLRPGGLEAEQIRKKLSIVNNGKDLISTVSGSNINRRMLMMLSHKRVDVVVSDYNVLRYLNSNPSFGELIVKPIALVRFTPVFMAFEHEIDNFNKLDRQFTSFLSMMRKTGKLSKILKKYNLSDWNRFVVR